VFDPERYQEQMEASRRRIQAAEGFREADRVPQRLTAAGSFYTQLFGGDIAQYYTDIDFQIEIQVRGFAWRLENVQDDCTDLTLYYDPGPVQEAIAFGCEIEYPPATSPRIIPCLQTPRDIDLLDPPEPEDNPRLQEFLARGKKFQERAGRLGLKLPIRGAHVPQIHPPLSCACALMEPRLFYSLMLEEPVAAKKLLVKCFLMFCKLVDYEDRRTENRRRALGLADDNSCFISHPLYRDQVLPFNWVLYERYGPDYRSLHTDGPSQQHFACYANELRLNFMDIGGWSDLEAAVQHMKGKTVLLGAMNNRDFYGDSDARLKKKIRHQMATAGPGGGYIFAIGGETYAGVNVDTVIKGFEYAREIGRYPLSLPPEDYSDVRYGGPAYGVPKQ